MRFIYSVIAVASIGAQAAFTDMNFVRFLRPLPGCAEAQAPRRTIFTQPPPPLTSEDGVHWRELRRHAGQGDNVRLQAVRRCAPAGATALTRSRATAPAHPPPIGISWASARSTSPPAARAPTPPSSTSTTRRAQVSTRQSRTRRAVRFPTLRPYQNEACPPHRNPPRPPPAPRAECTETGPKADRNSKLAVCF